MRKKANNSSAILLSMLVATLVAAGCKAKEETPSAPQAKPVNKAAKPVQMQTTSAKIAEIAEQPLDFSNKKDPFKPFVIEPVPQQKARPAVVARSGEVLPIQAYDVSRFTVTGIIVGLKENTALIIDPAGKGYVVKVGMLIGNSDGRISRITPSSIEVVETYRDDNGRIRKRTVMLTLAKKR